MESALIPVGIMGTGVHLGGARVTTEEIAQKIPGARTPEELIARTGIETRYWASAATDAVDLGRRALEIALDAAELSPRALARLIFVSSTGGDVLIPATASNLVRRLDPETQCDVFDVNNACMGFMTAFDLGARSIATGLGPVAIVVVETLSRFIAPESPRSYAVLGDAAAAVVLGPARQRGQGILASFLAHDAMTPNVVSLAHPGRTGRRETIEFGPKSSDMTAHAVAHLKTSAQQVLERAQLSMCDVDYVLPHQPNGSMSKVIVRDLGVAPERIVPVVEDIGSVGAASIAVSLDRLYRQRRPRDARILMIGIGGGVSYGAILYQTGAGNHIDTKF